MDFFFVLIALFSISVRSQSCPTSLAGRATGLMTNPLFDNYVVTQTSATTYTVQCYSGPEPSATPSSVCGWTSGVISVSGSAIQVVLDSKVTLNGQLNCASTQCSWVQQGTSCSWGPAYCNLITDTKQSCVRADFTNNSTWIWVPTYEKVHLIFMNHLDVGYNGIPTTGFINNILNIYFHEYYPRAYSVAQTLIDDNFTQRLVYTTHPWLVSLFLNCPPNLELSGIPLICPSPTEVDMFKEAVNKGFITWHRGPFNLQPENMDGTLFEGSLDIAAQLDALFNLPVKQTLSQRDVPGMTRSVIPWLLKNNASAISVGVNDGTCPPRVPKAFIWRDVASNSEILTLVHPYGYPDNPGTTPQDPQGIARSSCVEVPGHPEALCWVFRTDNSGPPLDVSEVLNNYQVLQAMFPGSPLVASTFDAFAAGLNVNKQLLPVVTNEIGDVWIQGIPSDPQKMAQFRALNRVRSKCLEGSLKGVPQCNRYDPYMLNLTRFLIKPPEHTWGLPGINDYTYNNFSNAALQERWDEAGYQNCDKGWSEQRMYNQWALEAAGPNPKLQSAMMQELAATTPIRPNLDLYTPIQDISPSQTFTCARSNFSLWGFDATGALNVLQYRKDGSKWCDSNHVLGGLTYQVYDEKDFAPTCNGVFGGHGGQDASSHAVAGSYPPTLTGLYALTSDPCVYLARVEFSADLISNYGAPAETFVQFDFASRANTVLLELLWFSKTSTKIAEAFMFNFQPLSPGNTQRSWYMDKLGYFVEPSDVVWGGNKYQHSVWSGVYFSSSRPTSTSRVDPGALRISSLDAPMISPVLTRTGLPTALVPDVETITASNVTGMAYNVFNNVWNTNYIFYYPYLKDSGEADMKFRFALELGQ